MNTLSRLRAIGYQIQVEGEEIVCRWEGSGRPEAAQVRPLLEELRQHKAEAIEELTGSHAALGADLPSVLTDWPEEWLESYLERVAIMHHDGGLEWHEAERRAEELVRQACRRRRCAEW